MSGDAPVDVQELARQMLENKTGNEPSNEDSETDDSGNTNDDSGSTDDGEPLDDSQLTVGGHPAWEEILSAVPEEYHAAIAPKLKEWDAGVTRRFQEIHSQYDPLKEFEPLVDSGMDADSLSQAIGLFQALNQNPQQVYETLGQAYGFSEQGSTDDDDDDDDNNYQLPRHVQEQLDRQERAIEYMAEQMQNQTTAEQMSAQEQELENYLEGLSNQYGEFDEDYVLTKMASGVDGEVAVRQYQEITGTSVPKPKTAKKAPKVLGRSSGVGSGGIPTDSPEIGKLSDIDVRNLVTAALQATEPD